MLWNKLRIAVMGAALFKRAGARREARRREGNAGATLPRVLYNTSRPLSVPADPNASRTSLDSGIFFLSYFSFACFLVLF